MIFLTDDFFRLFSFLEFCFLVYNNWSAFIFLERFWEGIYQNTNRFLRVARVASLCEVCFFVACEFLEN